MFQYCSNIAVIFYAVGEVLLNANVSKRIPSSSMEQKKNNDFLSKKDLIIFYLNLLKIT